jgi:hypothetical protein
MVPSANAVANIRKDLSLQNDFVVNAALFLR